MHGLLNSIGVNIPSFGVKRALYGDFRYPIVHIRNFDVIVCDFGLRLTLLNLLKAKVNFLLA